MGRRRKYFSDIEKKEANNNKVKEFYWKNKDRLDDKARTYYWRKKIQALLKTGDTDAAEKVKNSAIKKGIDPAQLEIEIQEL